MPIDQHVNIKICGLRRKEDISYVNRFLPEYAGFVFAPGRRQVTCDQVKEMALALHPRIQKAGIFVNEDPDKILQAVRECCLDVLQLHGDETPAYIRALRLRLKDAQSDYLRVKLWKAIRVKDASFLAQLDEYPVDAFVLDAYAEESYGGMGKAFDWDLAVLAAERVPVILAGGLSPENVPLAIRKVHPMGVDVSSGVETEGWKDPEKIQAFIQAVRSGDCGS